MLTPASFAAFIVILVGGLIYWSNPSRRVNRAVCFGSVHIAIWLGCLHIAMTVNPIYGAFWVRLTSAVGSLFPLNFWMVKESIVQPADTSLRDSLRRNWPWLLVAVVLVWVPFTDYFIPSHSTPERHVYGWAYFTYAWVLLGIYGILILSSFRSSTTLKGAPRLELQIWLGGGCAMLIAIMATMALNAITGDRMYIRMQPLFTLIFYAGVSYVVTARRIFNARQILLVVVEKSILVGTVAVVAYVLDFSLSTFLPAPFAFVATTAATLWIAVELNGALDRWFQFYPQATAARQAAFAIARRESRIGDLENAFVSVLKGWGQSDHAVILSGTKGSLSGMGIKISESHPAVGALRQLRWATPERLARERPSAERKALAAFLAEHGLGVAVFGEGPSLTLILGVGVGASRRPFTYPQVAQLTELTSIIESVFERAHFSVAAQRAEQLATVGLLAASLAHEIRNPLVTIKTFVQLLPRHHQDESFRTKFFGLINDEVTRIDRLTEQLLDLASPRVYQAQNIALHPVLHASVELVVPKAADKNIEFMTNFQATPDFVFTDPSAAKQVLLNLCFNAIQAVETIEAKRWVKISTRNVTSGVEMAVQDSGPGIAEDIRPRLFQPFQSNKSSGFGLGLAICSDFLAGLDATISVDPKQPGHGASFRVVFPTAGAISASALT
ncbi:MAG TPA: ATP-binding protein [Opitutus sp.]|nr:ATP-binding protein [Opitutus sp.]